MSNQQVNFRIDRDLLDAIKTEAQKSGVGYSRWIMDAARMRLQGTLLETIQHYPPLRIASATIPQPSLDAIQELVQQQVEQVTKEWQNYIVEQVDSAILDCAIQVKEVKADVATLEERLESRTTATNVNLSNVLDGIQRLNGWIGKAGSLLQRMQQQIASSQEANASLRSQFLAIQNRLTPLEGAPPGKEAVDVTCLDVAQMSIDSDRR